MDYKMEELLPVAAKLARRYTSNESTSVSYNTARQLMEAVLYCIKECEGGDQKFMLEGGHVDCETAYKEGYRIVLEKAELAKTVYHNMLSDFDDYGCRNYKDTILKGLPGFFLKYDARFEPQNHILTLDYPVLYLSEDTTGVDRILDYIREVQYEQMFLRHFSREGIMKLLEYTRSDYSELYLENICIPVLLRAAACMIAEENVYTLELSETGQKMAVSFFSDIPLETAEQRFGSLLDMLENKVMQKQYRGRFKTCARNFAVRIQNGSEL